MESNRITQSQGWRGAAFQHRSEHNLHAWRDSTEREGGTQCWQLGAVAQGKPLELELRRTGNDRCQAMATQGQMPFVRACWHPFASMNRGGVETLVLWDARIVLWDARTV